MVKAFELAKGDLTTASKVTDLATFDGYYKLATNITFTDSNQPTEKYSYALDSGSNSNADIAELFNSSIKGNYGLTGTFDGDGYTIYNLKTQNGGLFGLVSGTIKNVGFVQLSSATPTTGVLARFVYRSGNLENVYIKSDKYDGTPSEFVADSDTYACIILSADHLIDIRKTIMSAGTSVLSEAECAERNIQVVRNDEKVLYRNLQFVHPVAYSLAAEVHVC